MIRINGIDYSLDEYVSCDDGKLTFCFGNGCLVLDIDFEQSQILFEGLNEKSLDNLLIDLDSRKLTIMEHVLLN